jgi:hypothetical protein
MYDVIASHILTQRFVFWQNTRGSLRQVRQSGVWQPFNIMEGCEHRFGLSRYIELDHFDEKLQLS